MRGPAAVIVYLQFGIMLLTVESKGLGAQSGKEAEQQTRTNFVSERASSRALSGKVVRAGDGQSIAGALVEVIQTGTVRASTQTAGDGTYSVQEPPEGAYEIRVTAPSFVTETARIGKLERTSAVDFKLTEAGRNATIAAQSGSGDISYVYDEMGRLVAVIDPAGDSARYSYDAVGNLLAISRWTSTSVSVIEFTPNSGPVGESVTIWGTGFSSTASENTVTFNSVGATVTSATPTQIVATVPSGATTGPITVTSPSGSATSSNSFVVGTATGVPTISGFSPTVVNPGAAVTISGTNFDGSVHNNRVKVNVVSAAPASSSSTSIGITTPSTGSGRVSVATASGTAVSAGDLIVLTGYVPGDLNSSGRMEIGETSSISVTTSAKISD